MLLKTDYEAGRTRPSILYPPSLSFIADIRTLYQWQVVKEAHEYC